ncbi:MAG: site-2 protease family protein [Phycisphaerales bacterium]|nr:site-2 protease family protein [Phycisphaerales bacterium]
MSQWWGHQIYADFGGGDAGTVAVVSWAVIVIGAITLHELGHGWAALWEGDNTPREYGRMTANPIVHMGTMSLLMFAIIGIAWGLMPVRPDRFRHGNAGRALVAFAGPAVNLILFLLFATCYGLLLRSGATGDFASNLKIFLTLGGLLNGALLLFNLLPLPPLDGWCILESLLRQIAWRPRSGITKALQPPAAGLLELSRHPNAPMASLFVLFALFWTGGFGWFFAASVQATHWWARLIAG